MGKSLESRFEEYGEVIGAALAHADRRMPAQWYLRGLMLPGGRKSVEPMAARVQPQNVRSAHQSMHHLVADAEWSDQGLLAAVTAQVLPVLVKKDAACHWIIDDTGYGKKGTHSVGVARQYCGRLGKTDNCQVAVSLSIANAHGSLPVGYQLYLPQDWASDPARRKRAGVPAEIEFRTKGDMALEQIHQALNAGLPRGVVLADAAYGTEAAWRDQLTTWGLQYAVAVREHTRVWYGKHRPAPTPPASPRGGRPRTRLVIDETHAPVTVVDLAQALPARHWRQVTWRAGTNAPLRSRFTALRVRAANLQRARPEEWLLIEWPLSEEKPVHYWLCTLPANTAMKALVATAMGRWRIERDYQELKSELGLHHYEGRNWRGFHHHASLCIAAYGFLMRERLRSKKNSAQLKAPAVPKGLRPRGARADATARSQLDRHDGLQPRPSDRKRAAHVPLLWHKRRPAEANFINTVELRRVRNTAGRPVSSLHGCLVDRDDNIWMIGSTMLARVSLPRDTAEPVSIQWKNKTEPLIRSDIIGWKGQGSQFLEDREGNVWMASANGVDRFFKSNLTRELNVPEGFVGLAAGKQSEVWVGGRMSAPILQVRDGKATPTPGFYEVSSLITAQDQSVWFGGPRGLIRYQEGKFSTLALPTASQGFEVQAMAQEPSGALWMSAGRKGVFRYDNGSWAKNGAISTLPDARVLSASTDHSGNVWFGYPHNQMAMVKEAAATVYGQDDGLNVGNVTAIYGKRTKLWAAGEFGLAYFDGHRFQPLRPEPPLEFSGISGIVETSNGDLWLNGSSGIVHVEAKNIHQLEERSTSRVRGEVFGNADGLQGLGDYLRPVPTAIEATDGRLWFATSRGVFSVDPTHIYRNLFAPPVHISALHVGERAFAPAAGITLPERTTALRVDYVGLSMTMPEKVRYRYKLDGQNTDWQEAHGEQTNFVDLHPGLYRFHVIASNNDGVWNNTGAALDFVIPPAFTQTRWFIALCATGLAVLAWMGFTFRMRQVTARFRLRLNERLRERERIARELHDTLLQSTQGLMLRVQATRNRIQRGDPRREELDVALKRADEVMAEARDRVQDLRVPEEARADLTKSLTTVGEALSLGRVVVFKVHVEGTSRKLRSKCVDEVYAIGREALTNAFHHAQANAIDLKIAYGASDLRMAVLDDGCGIEPHILNRGERPGHWGLKGMRERAREVGARVDIRRRTAGGTEVEIWVPSAFARTGRRSGFRWIRVWRA